MIFVRSVEFGETHTVIKYNKYGESTPEVSLARELTVSNINNPELLTLIHEHAVAWIEYAEDDIYDPVPD